MRRFRHSELDCCHCETPFLNEKRLCCDDEEGCRRFDEECRDCFWPWFAHPTWLCCRELYGCCKRKRECEDRNRED